MRPEAMEPPDSDWGWPVYSSAAKLAHLADTLWLSGLMVGLQR